MWLAYLHVAPLVTCISWSLHFSLSHTDLSSVQRYSFVYYCRTLMQLDWRRLESFHMRCQRRILRIRWHDYIPNNEVLHRTGLLAASSIVCKRRLGLFGHVARLADDVQANRILWTCCEAQDGVRPRSDWKRAWGRPTTWT